LRATFKRHGIDAAELLTDGDCLPALHQLFKRRARRRTS
jgi:hypothetical protein